MMQGSELKQKKMGKKLPRSGLVQRTPKWGITPPQNPEIYLPMIPGSTKYSNKPIK